MLYDSAFINVGSLKYNPYNNHCWLIKFIFS
jgi:hypothetical protein